MTKISDSELQMIINGMPHALTFQVANMAQELLALRQALNIAREALDKNITMMLDLPTFFGVKEIRRNLIEALAKIDDVIK